MKRKLNNMINLTDQKFCDHIMLVIFVSPWKKPPIYFLNNYAESTKNHFSLVFPMLVRQPLVGEVGAFIFRRCPVSLDVLETQLFLSVIQKWKGSAFLVIL